jgi:inner membrane protein
MPTILTHAVSAAALAVPLRKQEHFRKILIAGMICSMIPDADAIGFFLGIPYESMWGHRGITHSFFFALLLSIIVTPFLKNDESSVSEIAMIGIYIFLATASHAITDGMTNGGKGVAYFAPFENSRCFLPWRPVQVSPMTVRSFISARGLLVIKSEVLWLWLPSVLFAVAALMISPIKKFSKASR